MHLYDEKGLNPLVLFYLLSSFLLADLVLYVPVQRPTFYSYTFFLFCGKQKVTYDAFPLSV